MQTWPLWESYYENNKWHWRQLRQNNEQRWPGEFSLKTPAIATSSSLLQVGPAMQIMPTMHPSTPGFRRRYAMVTAEAKRGAFMPLPDRPAYRPKENGSVKFIARRFGNGVYSTPANQIVEYQINDPRGTKVT